MEVVALKDIDLRLQRQVENARKAIGKNPTYAASVLLNIVKRYPACLEVRKILREAQKNVHGSGVQKLNGFLDKVAKLSFSTWTESKIKQAPFKAIEAAEDLLDKDSSNPVGHKILGTAADILGLYETAVFACEEWSNLDPENIESAKALIFAYMKAGRVEDAIKAGEAASEKNPADHEIKTLIKKVSVEKSITKGKWGKDESFREKLRDGKQTQSPGEARGIEVGETALWRLIKDAKMGISEEPENLDHYRNLISYFRKLEEYDDALFWVRKARELESGRGDMGLERLAGTIGHEKILKVIAEKKADLKKYPDSPEIQVALDQLYDGAREFLRRQAENLAARYPKELSCRFELGKIYFEDDEMDQAIKELQLGLGSPLTRIRSLILLGKAYRHKEFFDLASEQFLCAKSEIPSMSEEKKEVLYSLGESYEKQGKMAEAVAEFKELYSVDAGYKNVSRRIDAHYGKKGKNKKRRSIKKGRK